MAKRNQPAIINEYMENGVKITVYAEKQTKHRLWQRGENFYGIVARADNFAGGSMVPFTRKPGKI